MTTPTTPAAPGGVNKKRRQLIALAVLLLVAGGLLGVAWFETRHNGTNAKVGDCVKPGSGDSVTIVDCDDPSASLKVVGRLENKSETDAEIDACDAFDDLGADRVFWAGEQGHTGLVLCLAPNTP